jgi:hypothetical protein
MKKGLSSGVLAVAVLVLMSAVSIAGGSFGGTWRVTSGKLISPAIMQVLQEKGAATSQDRLSSTQPNAPQSKIDGCPAPCIGVVLAFSGQANGIGAEAGSVNVAGAGIPIITCYSPGGNPSPGANGSMIVGTGTDGFGADDIDRRGKLLIPSLGIDPEAAGIGQPLPNPEQFCPNSNWTAVITSVQWVEGKIFLIQNGAQTACEVTIFEGPGGALAC